jgi:hypothetical protein
VRLDGIWAWGGGAKWSFSAVLTRLVADRLPVR